MHSGSRPLHTCTQQARRITDGSDDIDTCSFVVSAPDPNQPQHGSLPVSRAILEAIRAGVGLGLGLRLALWLHATWCVSVSNH